MVYHMARTALLERSNKNIGKSHVMRAGRASVNGPKLMKTCPAVSGATFIYEVYQESLASFTIETGSYDKMIELGRAVRENIWLLFICANLPAIDPYGMTSS